MGENTSSVKVRYSARDIQERVREVAARISAEYRERPLVLMAQLKGAAFFLADLSRQVTVPHSIEFINVTRRQAGGNESTEIDFATPMSITGKHVIILKDVVNTGVIETYLLEQLATEGPISLRFAAIVDRPHERRSSVLVDYPLFTSNDSEILVGYGMEREGRDGNLPDIGAAEQ